ncbi:DUF4258 domain-containing protein [Thermomonas sp.]|uniref:DUF4258 domain-containing protein n=1 Tax=Thermomonas sp. TaxID=1971895 RepID=UPI0035AF7F6B
MFSERFQRTVHITRHAAQRMAERGMDDVLLLDLLDTGTVKHKDDARLWVFKAYAERNDNLLCAAVVLETLLVVKTVMHHFALED